MSTPQPNTKSARHTKQMKSNGQNSRSVVSENEAYHSTELQTPSGAAKHKQRRKSHAKKNNNNNTSDAAIQSDGQAQRNVTHPVKMQYTPIKQQAYAGPTFHQSPAASALPMPSFYSKSLPTAGLAKVPDELTENPSQATVDGRPTTSAAPEESKRESTPLDFLFDAARKAKGTPGADGSQHRFLSPANGSPAARSPAGREGDTQFPFEFDKTPDELPTFITPYKERIEAARSTRATSDDNKSLKEPERQAMTAALKGLLLKPAQNSGGHSDNPFNARPAPATPPKHDASFESHNTNQGSGSNTPVRNGYGYGYGNNSPYFHQMSNTTASPGPKPPTSNLRHIYSPELNFKPAELVHGQQAEPQRISTARQQVPPQRHYTGNYYATQDQSVTEDRNSTRRPVPSAQELEDDMRRFLKLDLVSRG